MRRLVRTLAGAAALACMVLGAATASAAGPATQSAKAMTCAGGPIAPGTYTSLTVTSVCEIPDGTVTVHGKLTIANGAMLFASSPTARLVVTGNVWVGHDAVLTMGCGSEDGCAGANSARVNGNIVADQPLGLIIHGSTINGNIDVRGGGGGTTCEPTPIGFPPFSVIEDSQLNGNTSVSGLRTCWFGFIRNQVHGNVLLTDNAFADDDAMEVVTNHIWGTLACYGNDPAPQVGDSEGQPNVVKGRALGQCKGL